MKEKEDSILFGHLPLCRVSLTSSKWIYFPSYRKAGRKQKGRLSLLDAFIQNREDPTKKRKKENKENSMLGQEKQTHNAKAFNIQKMHEMFKK